MAGPSIAREKFPWFPRINYDVCASNLECLNFCPYNVFEWEKETGRPIVAHPSDCVPGCNICAQICRHGAISFPTKQEFHAALEKLRAEASIDGPPSKGRWG